MASVELEFIRRVAPGAQRGQKDYGVPASVTIAQAAVESAWGRKPAGGGKNLFGIKAHLVRGKPDPGPIAIGFVKQTTTEFEGGKRVVKTAFFRKYRTIADSIRDHGRFLRDNSIYKPAFKVADDANAFARALQKAGYATDPHYAATLISIMKKHNLYRYDKGLRPVTPKPGPGAPKPGVKPKPGVTPAPGAAPKPGVKPKPGAKPKPVAKPKPALTPAQIRARAFLVGLQRDLNEHLLRLGSSRRLAVDGRWDPHTKAAFEQVCRILGIEPERSVRTFRLIAGAAALPRTDAERARAAREAERAAKEGAAFAKRLKAHFDDMQGVGVAVAGGKQLAAAKRAEAHIVTLQRDLNSHLRQMGSPRVLSVDGTWNPFTVKAFEQVCKVLGIAPERTVRTFRLVGAAAAVPLSKAELDRAATEGATFRDRLEQQFAEARAARQAVVVGGKTLPEKERAAAAIAGLQRDLNTQLKWLGARRRLAVDGSWDPQTQTAFNRVCKVLGLQPERNVRTFRVIAGATATRSQAELARADTEGVAFEEQLKAYFAIEPSVLLTQAGKPGDAPAKGDGKGTGKTPRRRTFRVRSPEMKGNDIKAFQRVLNERLKRWNVNLRVEPDSEYGTETRRVARLVACGLGIAEKDYKHGMTFAVREKIRDPRLRTPAELARAENRREWRRRVRRRYKGGGVALALEFARKHIGLREHPKDRGPLIDLWNTTAGSPLGSMWCGNFMNACLMAAGFQNQRWLAACRWIESEARKGTAGWKWTMTPRAGDLCLITIDNVAGHVGIVESVSPTEVVTIEGNTHLDGDPSGLSDRVARRHRRRGATRGYARPPYSR